MSGIAAIFERDGAPASGARIASMLDRLRRRGPDRGAHHLEGSVALAQSMLETTPEDALDRQPRRSRSGLHWIVADARVDNRRELLSLVGAPGEDRDEVPDSELILRAYQRWGEACPARLIGDFAFAIWDGERRHLFCARDHLGVRALYYHHDGASFRCATEMDVLFADRRVTRRPDRSSIALFLTYSYAERDATLYEGVHALPPGHALTVTTSTIRRSAYWQPDPWGAIPASSDEDYASRFHDVFSEAVRCRLRSSRPVGAEVSGGLDSSSVACEAERLRRSGRAPAAPLELVRAAFPGLDCDEQPYSQAVADHLGLPLTTCYPLTTPDICKLEQSYPDLYFHPTGTMVDAAFEELRRRGTRVVLSGHGGDLLMSGTTYDGAHFLRRGRLRAALESAGLTSDPFWLPGWRWLAVQGLWAFAPEAAVRLKAARRSPLQRWPWLSREAAEIVGAHVTEDEARMRALHPDLLRADLCHEISHGVGTHLPAVIHDRMVAARAMEYRHPFYDVRVIELLLALPGEQRFTRARSKRVLRRAMGPALPSPVRERSDKAEFSSYVRRVFLEGQRAALEQLFATSRLHQQGLVDPGAARKLLASPSQTQSSVVLGQMTAMELWLRAPVQPTVTPHFPGHHEDRHEHA